MSKQLPGGVEHFRTLRARPPFTLNALEAFCATLRAHDVDGEQEIRCEYQVTLQVRIDEPLLTPTQLRAM